MIKPHTSDIRMAYEYIWVTYGWHTSTYKWHADDIRVHTSDIRRQTSTYDWHMNSILVHIDKTWTHTNTMQMTCEWNIKPYKEFGAFKSQFSKLFVVKTLF